MTICTVAQRLAADHTAHEKRGGFRLLSGISFAASTPPGQCTLVPAAHDGASAVAHGSQQGLIGLQTTRGTQRVIVTHTSRGTQRVRVTCRVSQTSLQTVYGTLRVHVFFSMRQTVYGTLRVHVFFSMRHTV